jgi:hypothetical protein
VGNKSGELMITSGAPPQGPTGFGISRSYQVYVVDGFNGRIAIFDLKMSFIRNIPIPAIDLHYRMLPETIKIDENDNMVLYGDLISSISEDKDSVGLMKISKEGNRTGFHLYRDLFGVGTNAIESSSIDRSFYLIGDKIFYNDLEKKIRVIDEKGDVLPNDKTQGLIKTTNMLNIEYKVKADEVYNAKNPELKLFPDKNLYISGRFYTRDLRDYKKYVKIKRNNRGSLIKDKLPINIDEMKSGLFLDYDKDGNSYWYGYSYAHKTEAVLVLSPENDILDWFATPGFQNYAVASTGDVYFMKKEVDGMIFYKVLRSW